MRHIIVLMLMHHQVVVDVVADLFRQSIISTEMVEKRLLRIMGLHQVEEEIDARQIDSIEIQTLQITTCSCDKLNDINKRPP